MPIGHRRGGEEEAGLGRRGKKGCPHCDSSATTERADFGYPAAEAIGHSFDLIVPERLRARHWEGYRRVMATGTTHYDRRLLTVPALRKDGTRIFLEFTVVIVYEPPGEVFGVAAVPREVTARWQRDKAIQARLAALERNV